MLLTRKSTNVGTSVARRSRNVAAVLGKTIDRRTFLKRSGLTLGAGAVASQLPYGMIGKAEAQSAADGAGETQGRRQAGARLDWSISAGRNDGGRDRDATDRRYAARRPSVAAAVEYPAR